MLVPASICMGGAQIRPDQYFWKGCSLELEVSLVSNITNECGDYLQKRKSALTHIVTATQPKLTKRYLANDGVGYVNPPTRAFQCFGKLQQNLGQGSRFTHY